ncbi:hypothetical protein [Nocardia heshunensis]
MDVNDNAEQKPIESSEGTMSPTEIWRSPAESNDSLNCLADFVMHSPPSADLSVTDAGCLLLATGVTAARTVNVRAAAERLELDDFGVLEPDKIADRLRAHGSTHTRLCDT